LAKRGSVEIIGWADGGYGYRSIACLSCDQTLVGRGRVKLIDYGSMLLVEEVKVWPDAGRG
jgi:hypothetical protein